MTVELARDDDRSLLSRSKDDLTNMENEAANRISSAFSLMKSRLKRKSKCENEIGNQFINGPIRNVSFCKSTV